MCYTMGMSLVLQVLFLSHSRKSKGVSNKDGYHLAASVLGSQYCECRYGEFLPPAHLDSLQAKRQIKPLLLVANQISALCAVQNCRSLNQQQINVFGWLLKGTTNQQTTSCTAHISPRQMMVTHLHSLMCGHSLTTENVCYAKGALDKFKFWL